MDNSNQQPQVESSGQPQHNTHGQPQVDSQEHPPSYTESVKNSSQTGYDNYPQSYPQIPATYPTQQGYAATADYDPSKAAYPTQGYQPGGGYTNYGHQPYYPPPPASNNNQAVSVAPDTQNLLDVPGRNYTCSAIFAIFMFMPTGVLALLKANEAQHQYRMGNVERGYAFNMEARKLIRISFGVGVVLIIFSIVFRVLLDNYFFNYD
ncbi:EWSR1 [Acanthosepion pharaonis]|uniref:EWSR1 n=1 Tax=Acanthosepion pharaonis TaxID=158019 RepID=A0A812DAC4_ACAPH|nr:EWSR1 [Sepia pharaonis]